MNHRLIGAFSFEKKQKKGPPAKGPILASVKARNPSLVCNLP